MLKYFIPTALFQLSSLDVIVQSCLPISQLETQHMNARADWAGWLPGICHAGRLVRRPDGPPRQMLKLVERFTPLTEKGR